MSKMINAAAEPAKALVFASEAEAIAVVKAALPWIKDGWDVLPFAMGDDAINSIGVTVCNENDGEIRTFYYGDIPVEGAASIHKNVIDAIVYILRKRITEAVEEAENILDRDEPVLNIEDAPLDSEENRSRAEMLDAEYGQASDFMEAYNLQIGDVNIASAWRIVSFATWRSDFINNYIL